MSERCDAEYAEGKAAFDHIGRVQEALIAANFDNAQSKTAEETYAGFRQIAKGQAREELERVSAFLMTERFMAKLESARSGQGPKQ